MSLEIGNGLMLHEFVVKTTILALSQDNFKKSSNFFFMKEYYWTGHPGVGR